MTIQNLADLKLSQDKIAFLIDVVKTIIEEDDQTEYCEKCLFQLHAAEDWYATWRLNDGNCAKIVQPEECKYSRNHK